MMILRKVYIPLFFLLAVVFLCPAAHSRDAVQSDQSQSVVSALPNFSPLVKRLTPVTVNISTTKTVKTGMRRFGTPFHGPDDPFRDFFGDDFLRRFFGDIPEREFKQQSLGSGFVIDKEGYILTNNHVVENADEIKVKTHNTKEYDAEIVGRDPKTDLALIKIKDLKNGLTVATLGDSDELLVGEWVIAIGNPFGLQETVTTGIVSAKWRKIGQGPYEDFIQTDASINPGNSGGPLFNMDGQVVGVNTMIYSPSGGNIGIGFAIPINLAKNIVRQLKDRGRVIRGWLGVVVQTVTPDLAESFGLDEGTGALVSDVEPNGPAENAGIRAGDIILRFDGQEVEDMSTLPLMVAETPVGKKVKILIVRNGEKITRNVKIGELKDKQVVEAAPQSKEDLGVSVREITPELAGMYGLPEEQGVIITAVAAGSPAAEAGLRKGDIIKEINRRNISTYEDYSDAVENRKNDKILFLIKRGKTSLWLVVKMDD